MLRIGMSSSHADSRLPNSVTLLCNKSAGSRTLVSPCRSQDTDTLVISRQTVDARLDQNEAELGVLVFAVALEMLTDGDGLEFISTSCDEVVLLCGVQTFFISM